MIKHDKTRCLQIKEERKEAYYKFQSSKVCYFEVHLYLGHGFGQYIKVSIWALHKQLPLSATQDHWCHNETNV